MSRPTVVAGFLHVDLGGVPRARYECRRCGVTEGPVSGPGPVRIFVEQVRDVHRGRCRAAPGATAGTPDSASAGGGRSPITS